MKSPYVKLSAGLPCGVLGAIGGWGVPRVESRTLLTEPAALLLSPQDNYTFAQPGIQRKVKALEELVSRIDGKWEG